MSSELPQNRVEDFELLARENAEMLSSYLRSLLGADSSVDDLFQEVLVVAWRRMKDYDRARPFGAWLRGIGRNIAMEHSRKTSTRLACEDPHVLDLLDARYDSFASGASGSFSERIDRVLRCLAELPVVMREVMEMAYARGMMLKEIAASLAVAEETVKKRVQRSRGTLAECMRKSEAAS